MLRARLARLHARRLSRASQPTLEYLNVYRDTMADLQALETAEPETVAAFFAAAVLPLRRAYAWAVPSHEALSAIAEASPRGVVEIGAGTGYWASELRCRGVSVAAYDIAPVHLDLHNGYHHLGDGGNALPWFDVQAGGAEAAAAHSERTLLLCWPPKESEPGAFAEVATLAVDCLEQYGGDTVCFVGGLPSASPDGIECAGPRFEAKLRDEYTLEREIALPSWPPVSDSLGIWRRAAAVDASAAPPPDSEEPAADDDERRRLRGRARDEALASLRSDFDSAWLRQLWSSWARGRLAGTPAPALTDAEEGFLARCLARGPGSRRLAHQLASNFRT